MNGGEFALYSLEDGGALKDVGFKASRGEESELGDEYDIDIGIDIQNRGKTPGNPVYPSSHSNVLYEWGFIFLVVVVYLFLPNISLPLFLLFLYVFLFILI